MNVLSATLDLPLDGSAPLAGRTLVRRLLIAWHMTDRAWLNHVERIVGALIACARMRSRRKECIELAIQADHQHVVVRAVGGSVYDGVQRLIRRSRSADDLGGDWGVSEFVWGRQAWVRLPPYPARHTTPANG